MLIMIPIFPSLITGAEGIRKNYRASSLYVQHTNLITNTNIHRGSDDGHSNRFYLPSSLSCFSSPYLLDSSSKLTRINTESMEQAVHHFDGGTWSRQRRKTLVIRFNELATRTKYIVF